MAPINFGFASFLLVSLLQYLAVILQTEGKKLFSFECLTAQVLIPQYILTHWDKVQATIYEYEKLPNEIEIEPLKKANRKCVITAFPKWKIQSQYLCCADYAIYVFVQFIIVDCYIGRVKFRNGNS